MTTRRKSNRVDLARVPDELSRMANDISSTATNVSERVNNAFQKASKSKSMAIYMENFVAFSSSGLLFLLSLRNLIAFFGGASSSTVLGVYGLIFSTLLLLVESDRTRKEKQVSKGILISISNDSFARLFIKGNSSYSKLILFGSGFPLGFGYIGIPVSVLMIIRSVILLAKKI